MQISRCCIAAALALNAGTAVAGAAHFSFQDWEVACDNTRRCEAVGFQADDGEALPVALALARAAGPSGKVTAKLIAGSGEPEKIGPLIFHAGRLTLRWLTNEAELTPDQTARLVAALPGMLEADVADVTDGKATWHLSLAGMKAALLKMDDLQGRVGTVTALVKPGPKPASGVLPALPAPVLNRQATPPAREEDAALLPAILAKLPKGGCEFPRDLGGEPIDDVRRLSATQLLVLVECSRSAYQSEYVAWVVADKTPYAARSAPLAGGGEVSAIMNASFDNSELSSYAKGRGIYDCGEQRSWVWTADGFQLAMAASSQSCRGMPGGYSLTEWRTLVK
jgi:hypothetical protein